MVEDEEIKALKGIGEKTCALFHKLDVFTVGDLISLYPRDYDIYEEPCPVSELEDEGIYAVRIRISSPVQVKRVRNLQIATATGKDNSGNMEFTWFNMPFLKKTLHMGAHFVFRGKVVSRNGRISMQQPEIFTESGYREMTGAMQPVYPLTEGLTNKNVSKAVKQALDSLESVRECLPAAVREKYGLCEYNYAVRTVHFPGDRKSLDEARKRLVFDEFFFFVMALRRLKDSKEQSANSFRMKRSEHAESLIRNLPYELTAAQKKVWEEVKKDLEGPKIMGRLIQGDVGSGKTIVSVLALIMTAENGCQGALMVPTEVLAAQHFASITEILEKNSLPYRAILLTGSMTARDKREACKEIEEGRADIIIGTHALIQEKVKYSSLALVVTDEQHRFGVKQREALANKGLEPNVMVMSATPIPRTLAIIIYGDLDISVIDELPAERLPIKNCAVGTEYRPKAYSFIENEVKKGRQAYVICPMVEESESIEAENVTEYAEMLKMQLDGSIEVACLHGKMKPKEKNLIMERFARNEIQVLVSTTVVEVGVNVPNASVMMIENAERFGLAQLHQLRGRVGRGKHQSYCILVSPSKSRKTRERLEILNKSNDGFFIASEDLKLRGPGDMFGIRQSGLMEFKIGDIYTDAGILQDASEMAGRILEDDDGLEKEENSMLKTKLDKLLSRDFSC